MTNVLIAGERSDLIAEAFRGMQARREADGWISITGRLEREPGEALIRALQRTEVELPRRIGSTRAEHRAAALDEIARQLDAPTRPRTRPENGRAEQERTVRAADAVAARFMRRKERRRHLTLVTTTRR
jgi:hypothetical protein